MLTIAEVSALNYETLHNAVYGSALVVEGFKGRPPLPLLSRAQAAEILHSLGAVILEELENNPSSYRETSFIL